MELTIDQALQKGIEAHKVGKMQEADPYYTAILKANPTHPDANHNMGVLAVDVGKVNEALPFFKTALEVNQSIAPFLLSYIDALIKVQRLDNAKQVIKQAKNHAVDRDRLNSLAARFSLKTQKPNTGSASPPQELLDSLLGDYQSGRFSEAEKLSMEITQEFPKHQFAWKVLGAVLGATGRLDEAEASLKTAIVLKPDYVEALHNLAMVQGYMNDLEAEIVSLQNIIWIDSDNFGLIAAVNLAICRFLKGNFEDSTTHIFTSSKIQEKTSLETQNIKNGRVYWRYLSNLLKWHQNKHLINKKAKHDKILYVVGESHSLTSHHLRTRISGIDFFCSSRLIKGCKQWHLGNAFTNQYKHQFEDIFYALPKHSKVLLAIGEIDCRLEDGIIAHKQKFPEMELKEVILTTVQNYITYIINKNSQCQHKVIIQGVPCPNIDTRNYSEKDIKQLVETIKIFNNELKMQSEEKGFGFLDTYQITDRGDGLSNGSLHLDDYHISPEGMLEAWRIYTHGSHI